MKIHFLLSLLLLFAIQINCSKPDSPEPINPNNGNNLPIEDTTFTYLALGDSYTIGTGVSENVSFPLQIIDSLFPNAGDDTTVTFLAGRGWTTDDLLLEIEGKPNLNKKFDFVSLLIGINNQYQYMDLEDYRIEFRELLTKALSFAGNSRNKVFVLSIPDYAYTPLGGGSQSISDKIDEYNAINKEITNEIGIQYFDITPISKEGLNDTELVSNDGLHPSGKQYTEWVKLMLPTLREKIR
jgi:lysophospholipase L1-like esterase